MLISTSLTFTLTGDCSLLPRDRRHCSCTKQSAVSSLHDYYPVTLTPILLKCFEKMVLQNIRDNIPASLDSHQSAVRTNRSMEDAVSTALHSVFTHLENKNRMLFADFSAQHSTQSQPWSWLEKLASWAWVQDWINGYWQMDIELLLQQTRWCHHHQPDSSQW